MQRPGYYWLAYDWLNLLLCCSVCNQRFKRNYFPLADESKRARSHTDDISQAQPLLVNPADEDPEQLISFREEIPYAIGGNHRAGITIELLGLDREILNERRRDRLAELRRLRDLLMVTADEKWANDTDLKALAAEARQVLDNAIKDTAEFAAMARASEGLLPVSDGQRVGTV